jgi:GTP cyclohydrolase I
MWKEIYQGYDQNPRDILTTFSANGHDQIILLKNIEIYSMCEHHMLPFFGKAHIAYLPNPKGKIVGISKLARLLDIYARRLQIQERVGEQVTSALMEYLKPQGAACIIEATHMCMRMRGVEKQNSIMTTSSMKGIFLEDIAAKNELINLIR